ncbi:hypothetical protein [Lacipirellula parvula]|nr:hypothetical protein [Lacipirellula parvula]
MWHTSTGERTLIGAEAMLVKEAITGVAEQIMEESGGYMEQWEYGIDRFDELTLSQRLKLLEQVATHLLTATAETLELTAFCEAAVGAIYEHVLVEVDWEIDDDDRPATRWRSLILAAYAECFGEDQGDPEDDFTLTDATSRDRDEWAHLVECLADNVLWDRDYEMDEFLDAPPETSRMLRRHMGIDDDYYSASACDTISNEAVEDAYRRLASLLE